MSYGWLTESSLIPQPAKKISIENDSLIDLKVAIQKEKDKPTKKKIPAVFERKNKGIELRNAKDITKSKDELDTKNKLIEKSKLYEESRILFKIVKIGKNIKGALVDFELKKFDNKTEEEKKEYEKEREEFYREKKEELVEREKKIVNLNSKTNFNENEKNEMERISWEKEALREIEQGMTSEMMENMQQKKPVVLQQYEKQRIQEEKDALPEVIEESAKEKLSIEEIKRKRQEGLELRKQKLRKLNENT